MFLDNFVFFYYVYPHSATYDLNGSFFNIGVIKIACKIFVDTITREFSRLTFAAIHFRQLCVKVFFNKNWCITLLQILALQHKIDSDHKELFLLVLNTPLTPLASSSRARLSIANVTKKQFIGTTSQKSSIPLGVNIYCVYHACVLAVFYT